MTKIQTAFLTVVLAFAAVYARGEDTMLLRAKTEILVEQAKEYVDLSQQKGSVYHTPAHQYYFGLIYASGTNLLSRKESAINKRHLESYYRLVQKDYDAYTKVEDATSMAAATGNGRGKSGGRHRAKRLINAEKLGDKELASAIRRWEQFVKQIIRAHY